MTLVATLGLSPVLLAQGQQRRVETADALARAAARARADSLYVSADSADHPQSDHAEDARNKRVTDSLYGVHSRGVIDVSKVVYASGADSLRIPAYLFQPLVKRGNGGHAALVWVHGGVHGDWEIGMFPFVREAVERGYVVIAPEYRGSTGYGRAHYDAVDYGGKELDDVASAVDYLRTLRHVDPERVGVMGWSHGGLIAALLLFREEHPFQGGAAIVPVANLVFRLAYKDPSYARSFSTQSGIRGLPFERREEYIKRSPVYSVDKLRVPILVHVATNDQDADFVETRQLVDALRARKPELAETVVYDDPPGGHSFSRRIRRETLERADTPEQRDSWNRTWTFFDRVLRPYEEPRRRD